MVEKQIQWKSEHEFEHEYFSCIKEFVVESDKVIIWAINIPDMDAIGAAIGILKVAQVNQKEGYIVLDQE